jgi:deoxycytidylate deaminase
MPFHPVEITNKWTKILDVVKTESESSNMSIKLGSVVIKGNKIVSLGSNINSRSRWRGETMPCLHAEMGAIGKISPRSLKSYQHPRSEDAGRGYCEKVPL